MTTPAPEPGEGFGDPAGPPLPPAGLEGVSAGAGALARRTRGGVRAGRARLRAGGAGESGLADLIEATSANAFADALVAVALAGTVFFNVPLGEARGKVALYLLITMAPFALLAPVLGPVLDRVRGRRVGLAVTSVVRAVLSWYLATRADGLMVFPIALGVLVMARAWGVTKAAIVPRTVPPTMTLVKVNSRIVMLQAVAAAVAAPLGLAVTALFGIDWLLRLAALSFLGVAWLALRLPKHVDSAEPGEAPSKGLLTSFRRTSGDRPSLGATPYALRGVVPLRALVGFLTIYLAFRLSEHGGSDEQAGKTGLALLAVAVIVGQAFGLWLGSRLSSRRPEMLVLLSLFVALVVCLAGAFKYTAPMALFVIAGAMLAGSMAKLALDAVIQRDVPEDVRTSAFARSETALQLAWVGGGALGLVPWAGWEAMLVGAVFIALGLVFGFAELRHEGPRPRRNRPPRRPPRRSPDPPPSR